MPEEFKSPGICPFRGGIAMAAQNNPLLNPGQPAKIQPIQVNFMCSGPECPAYLDNAGPGYCAIVEAARGFLKQMLIEPLKS